MNIKLICFLVLLTIGTKTKHLKADKIIKAISCGRGDLYTKGEDGIQYDNDQGLVSGESMSVDYHSDAAASRADIKFTIEKDIFMYERHTYSSMTYSLPVKTGKHTLIMKFAEMYFEHPGQRVFNIKIGDNVLIQNMDVVQRTGSKYAAHEEYIELNVKDGQIYVGGKQISNGIKNGHLQVSFVKGKADNPIIQAIILYHGPISQTTKADYDNLRKNWAAIVSQIKPLRSEKILRAINCGLLEDTTRGQNFIQYDNDQGVVSGDSVSVDYHSNSAASKAEIKFTIEKQIYMHQRHTYSSMTYTLPVKEGTHTLIMKFAQMYFEKPGQRVFNIKIGDDVVIWDMDIVERTGSKYAAHEEYLEFEVKDGQAYVNGKKINNGIRDGHVRVTFAKGRADNPIIQGIILYHGPVSETTKADYQNLKNNWQTQQQMLKAKRQNERIKELIAITKKNQILVIRNDQLLRQQEDSEQNDEQQKFGTLRSFLMGPIGIIFWVILIASGIYFVYSKVFLMSKSVMDSDHCKQI